MRKLLLSLCLPSIFCLSLSCDGDLEKVQLSSVVQKPSLSSDTKESILSKEKANEKAFELMWTKADYGNVSLATTYTIQVDQALGNFETPIKIPTIPKELNFEVSQQQVSSIVVGEFKKVPGVTTDIKLRIAAQPHKSVEEVFSNEITMSVVPFDPFTRRFLLIDGQDNSQALSLFAPPDNEGKVQDYSFEGYVYFPANSEFRVYKSFENSDYLGDSDMNGTSKSLVLNSNYSIKVVDEGTYRVQIDIKENTYDLLRVNWGIIGDATPTGWDSDTDLTYDRDAKVFAIDNISLSSSGKFKFRVNDDWGVELGYSDESNQYENLISGGFGNDFSISEDGNYEVILDLSNSINYKVKLKKL